MDLFASFPIENLLKFQIKTDRSKNNILYANGTQVNPILDLPARSTSVTLNGEYIPDKLDEMNHYQMSATWAGDFEWNPPIDFAVRYQITAMSKPVILRVPRGFLGFKNWNQARIINNLGKNVTFRKP